MIQFAHVRHVSCHSDKSTYIHTVEFNNLYIPYHFVQPYFLEKGDNLCTLYM